MAPPCSEITLIRHAPAAAQGRLFGRTDVAAGEAGLAAARALAEALPVPDHLATSPALRCRQTAAALWPGRAAAADGRLAEQDFGAWDGSPLAELPDLGPLADDALATHRPPGGESFDDACARAGAALRELALRGGSVAVVCHAGTVRAGLALALGGSAAALRFEVAPLSVTRLRPLPGGEFAVVCVNCRA